MKKLSKLIIYTTALAVLLSGLAACGNNGATQPTVSGTGPNTNDDPAPNYEAFVIGHSDSASGTTYQIENNIKETKEKTDTTVPQTVTLTINGYTVKGTYSHSEMRFPDNFYRHIYYGETRTSSFHLDDSGQLLYIVWKDITIDGREDTAVYTEEECLAIAKDFLLNNVSSRIDFADYTIKTIAYDNPDIYEFVLRKYISDCATTEEATISIRKNGAFFAYSSFMLGKFSADDMPKLDREKIIQTAEKKLDAVYANTKRNFASVVYEEPECYFTLLEDGKAAAFCTIAVRFEDGNGGSFGEIVSLLIT